jgi:radical SAM protein with 4Fe4S-binding SPASM domain
MPKNLKAKYKFRELSGLMARPGFSHLAFGDLLRPGSVRMAGRPAVRGAYKEFKPCFIHLSVTAGCNARCKGCINSAVTARGASRFFRDTDPVRDGRAIRELARSAGHRPVVICLYGGEPLLRPQKISSLMAQIDRAGLRHPARYMLYTNGQLLGEWSQRYPDAARRLWLISVSIDGTQRQHAAIRRGTDLREIEKGLASAAKIPGSRVLMWSTLREEQSLADCFEEFKRLYRRGLAHAFFWHWMETSSAFRDFPAAIRRYENDLLWILRAYRRALKTRGEVLPITHLNELLLYIAAGRRRGTTACGVERKENYDILGGRIYACADLPRKFAIGTIDPGGRPRLQPTDLTALAGYKDDLGCFRCGVETYCGGRCPVQALTSDSRRLLEYCQLMRLHVGVVAQEAPGIFREWRRHGWTLQRVYDQSVLYNQFTDVTP